MYYPYYQYQQSSEEMVNDLSPYTYPENLQKALRLIKVLLKSERRDELFYNYLVSIALNEEEREIMREICDDEIKHNKILRTIYYQLTGNILTYGETIPFKQPRSYYEGLKIALKNELDAVKQYQQILFGMKNPIHVNMLNEIITNELRHSGYYNMIIKEKR